MENIIAIIKILAMIQLIIIILFIILFSITRIIFQYKLKNRRITIDKINNILFKSIDDTSVLNKPVIEFFKHNIVEFILCFEKIDEEKKENKNWKKIKIIISDSVLKPQAKLLAFSSDWFKRYLATRCSGIVIFLYI